MTTALDIINLSLKSAGVLGAGQTAAAEDVNDALTVLNFMIGQWNRKRWLVFHLVDISCPCTGALSYTVGPGQSFNVPRPDRLEAAFFRQVIPSNPNQIDYPLEILQAREDYNNIALKALNSFPSYIFYDAAFPIGYVYPWPVPSNLYEVHITVKETLASFPTLTTVINLPPEYYAALLYNLTVRLLALYKLPADAVTIALAKEALNVIRGANAQIARLAMPAGVVRAGIYDPYADRIH